MLRRFFGLALAILMVCTLMPVMTLATETDTNLIANGSFDTGADGWVYGIRAGASATAATPVNSTMETTNTESYDADGYSFHVVSKDNPETVDAVENENLMLFYPLSDEELVKGNTYYVSLYVKTAVDSRVALKVRSGKMVNGGKTYLELNNLTTNGPISSPDGWKQFTGVFQYTAEKEPGVSIIVDVLNAGDVDFYVDNVEVASLNEDVNLVGNASFDYGLYGWMYGEVQRDVTPGIIMNQPAEMFTVGENGDHENALHIVDNTATRVGIKQYIPLTAADDGEYFSVSFSANLVSGSVSVIGLRAGDFMNGTVVKTFTLQDAGTDWHDYSAIFKYNHTNNGFSFLVDLNNNGTNTVLWLDNVVIEKVPMYVGDNLIANSSFDLGDTGWLTGEGISGGQMDLTSVQEHFIIDNCETLDGTVGVNALHITTKNSTRTVARQHIPLTSNDSGKTYYVSVYANITGVNPSKLGLRSGDRTNGTDQHVFTTSVGGGWKKYETTFTYTYRTGESGLSFVIDVTGSGADIWIDEVTLLEVKPEAGNKITNGAFTYGLSGWNHGGSIVSGNITATDNTSFKVEDCETKIGTVGEKALHIETASADRRVLQQYIPLTSDDDGKQFQVTAYLNLVSGGFSRFGVRGGNVVNGNDNAYSFYQTAPNAHTAITQKTNGWVRHSFVFTYNHNDTDNGVSFLFDLSSAANIWLDNVSVREFSTLLKHDGTFEAYDVQSGALSLSNYLIKDTNKLMDGSVTPDKLKGDMDLVRTDDGGSALKIIGATGSASNPVSAYLDNTKLAKIADGTLLKLTARVKVETENLAEQNTVRFRYGGTYDKSLSAGCVQTTAIRIPKENLNQWVDVAFYFNKRAIDSQLVSIVPGELTLGTDLLVDDLKVVPAEEAFFGAKAYALAETVTVRSSDPVAYETVAAVVDLPATGKAGTNAGFLTVNPAGAGNKMMITGLYRTKDGNRTLVDVQVSAFDKLAGDTVSIPAALEAGGSYAVENYICDGVGTLRPVGEKTTIAVIR